MSGVMVRYKVRPGEAERNEALVRAVYRELHERRPAGFRYATFRLDDGLTFVHLARMEAQGGRSPLPELAAFREFQAGIAERCDEQPVVTKLHEIGSFG
jgi:hypothetical protein